MLHNNNSSHLCITLTCNPLQASSVSSIHPFFPTECGCPLTMLLKSFKDEFCCNEEKTSTQFQFLELILMLSSENVERRCFLTQAFVEAEVWLHSVKHNSGCCPRSVCRCQRRSQNQKKVKKIATTTNAQTKYKSKHYTASRMTVYFVNTSVRQVGL